VLLAAVPLSLSLLRAQLLCATRACAAALHEMDTARAEASSRARASAGEEAHDADAHEQVQAVAGASATEADAPVNPTVIATALVAELVAHGAGDAGVAARCCLSLSKMTLAAGADAVAAVTSVMVAHRSTHACSVRGFPRSKSWPKPALATALQLQLVMPLARSWRHCVRTALTALCSSSAAAFCRRLSTVRQRMHALQALRAPSRLASRAWLRI
jgi:hypothetical protein